MMVGLDDLIDLSNLNDSVIQVLRNIFFLFLPFPLEEDCKSSCLNLFDAVDGVPLSLARYRRARFTELASVILYSDQHRVWIFLHTVLYVNKM